MRNIFKHSLLGLMFMLSSAVILAQSATEDFDPTANVFSGPASGTNWANNSWARSGTNGNGTDVSATNPSDGDDNIGGNLLQLKDNSAGAYRLIDLSTASTATLTFDYDYDNAMDGGETLLIQIDPENDGSFITLQTITATTTSPNPEINLNISIPSANLGGASTRIQFITGSNNSINANNEDWWIDNLSISVVAEIHSDGDGVSDSSDLDSDNDGIPDSSEGWCTPIINNASGESPDISGVVPVALEVHDSGHVKIYNETDVPYWNTTASNNAIEIWDNGNTLTSPHTNAHTGTQFMELNANFAASNYQDISTVPNTVIAWTVAHRGRYGTDVATVSIGTSGSVTVQTTMSTGNSAWVVYSGSYMVPTGQTTTRFQFDSVSSAAPAVPSEGNFIDSFTITCSQSVDSDGDGVPDYLDLDSDNDGIYDLVEGGALNVAGVNDSNNDGRIDLGAGSFGANGLYSTLENNDSSSATITYTISDSDSDGNRDALELDADNDGCTDVIEAGYTDPNGDGILAALPTAVNSDGLVTGTTVVDGYTTPRDGDSNSTYDFQEYSPLITGQPSDQTICPGDNGSFNVTAAGSGISYQWQVSTDGGANFSDLSDGPVYSNSNGPNLTITGATGAMDTNRYRVHAINTTYLCSPGVTSNEAILSVPDVEYTGSHTHATTPGGSEGSITLAGLTPSTTYSVGYLDDGIPVGPLSLTSGTSGEITLNGLNAGFYTNFTASLSGCTGPSLDFHIQDPLFAPSAPIPGGTYCGPSPIPTTCTYNPTTIPTTINPGEILCINSNTTHTGNILINNAKIYVSNGANFNINGALALQNGAEIILAECSTLSVNGSMGNDGSGAINAYCPVQTTTETINIPNIGLGVPTCNAANTYCPISSYFGPTITNANININPCATTITTTGNVTECEESPIQTLVALATPAVGASIVWYDAMFGGNRVYNPILNTLGTVTYYAEAVDNTTGFPGASRTAITLTITPSPVAPTGPAEQKFCGSGYVNGLRTDTGTDIKWYTTATGGTPLTPFTALTNGTYYASQTVAGCESITRYAVPVEILLRYAVVTFTDPTCGASDGSINLGSLSANTTYSVSYTLNGSTVTNNHTTNGSGALSVTGLSAGSYTGISFALIPSLCSTFVDQNSVTLTDPTPSITSTTPGTRIGTGTVSLGATVSLGTLNWFDVSSGGSSLGTGTTFTTPNISQTTIYYVEAVNSGCTSGRIAVIAYVLPDNDGDGVQDTVDLDDDNDGILDTQEGGCSDISSLSNGTNWTVVSASEATRTVTYNGNSVTLTAKISDQNDSGIQFTGINHTANHNVMISISTTDALPNPSGIVTITSSDPNMPVVLQLTDFDHIYSDYQYWEPVDQQPDQIVTGWETSDGTNTGTPGTLIHSDEYDADNNGADGTFRFSGTTYPLKIEIGVNRYANASVSYGNVGLDILGIQCVDTDTDGTPDYLDLDSDNDGCNDVVEAGFTDQNDDGILGNLPTTVDANGQVTGTSAVDGYTMPADGDSNTIFDFQEAGAVPIITTPPGSKVTFAGTDTVLNVVATGTALQYQWQVSTDGGTNYTNISDGAEYSGTNTSSLTIKAIPLDKSTYLYRVIVGSSSFFCGTVVSSSALITVRVRSVITNRRITPRVKHKN